MQTLLTSCVALSVLLGVAQQPPRAPQATEQAAGLSKNQVLYITRLVLNVEFAMRAGAYGGLTKVFHSRDWPGTLPLDIGATSPIDESSVKIRDYTLAIVASADGHHFQVSMSADQPCGYFQSTNEKGIIFAGKGLGCQGP